MYVNDIHLNIYIHSIYIHTYIYIYYIFNQYISINILKYWRRVTHMCIYIYIYIRFIMFYTYTAAPRNISLDIFGGGSTWQGDTYLHAQDM